MSSSLGWTTSPSLRRQESFPSSSRQPKSVGSCNR
jgi:hypothetical protein